MCYNKKGSWCGQRNKPRTPFRNKEVRTATKKGAIMVLQLFITLAVGLVLWLKLQKVQRSVSRLVDTYRERECSNAFMRLCRELRKKGIYVMTATRPSPSRIELCDATGIVCRVDVKDWRSPLGEL